ALADIRNVMESIEKARQTLIPTDFMKQGFSDTDLDETTIAINVLMDTNQPRQALAAAEQARGRAFLDLLATKGLTSDTSVSTSSSAASTRAHDLPSRAVATAASDQDLAALASRLNATVLAYWVGEDSTTIWTVSPAGQVTAVRAPTGESTLNSWIDDALGA